MKETDSIPRAKIIEGLKRHAGQDRFDRWLAHIEFVSHDGGLLTIGVPNRFLLEWIETKYDEIVKRAVREVLGEDTRVRYTIPGDLFQRFRKAGAATGERLAARGPEDRLHDDAHMGLNSTQTLATFVEGRSNRVAYRAALEVVRRPGALYNPLFVYGDTGLGKTHLLMGIAHAFLSRDSRLKVHYGSGEQFANSFVGSLKCGDIRRFRERYRSLDVLIVDDVHLLVTKRRSQEEFLHTFNALGDAGSQVVLASDAHPKAIQQLADRLVGRFVSGLVVRIEPPGYEVRRKILRNAAGRAAVAIRDDVLAYIARTFERNVRDLMGAFTRVVAYGSLEKGPIDRDRAAEILADLAGGARRFPSSREIIREVAAFYGVPVEEVASASRKRRAARARRVAMFLLRTATEGSLAEIGRLLGGRSHGTVASAVRRVQGLLATGDAIGAEIDELRRRLHLSV